MDMFLMWCAFLAVSSIFALFLAFRYSRRRMIETAPATHVMDLEQRNVIQTATTAGDNVDVSASMDTQTLVSPPPDPNDIQISGDVPLVGSEDISKSKTQRMLLADPPKDEKTVVIQDHVLLSFYQKLGDPKGYDLEAAYHNSGYHFPEDKRGIGKVRYSAHTYYDTMRIERASDLTELHFFQIPRGQPVNGVRIKTALDTNLDVGGSPVLLPNVLFAFKAIVLRLPENILKGDKDLVLGAGVLFYNDGVSHRRLIEAPLDLFVPLNPFDQNPRVFFYASDTIVMINNAYIHIWLSFPRAPISTCQDVDVRIELPGIRGRID